MNKKRRCNILQRQLPAITDGVISFGQCTMRNAVFMSDRNSFNNLSQQSRKVIRFQAVEQFRIVERRIIDIVHDQHVPTSCLIDVMHVFDPFMFNFGSCRDHAEQLFTLTQASRQDLVEECYFYQTFQFELHGHKGIADVVSFNTLLQHIVAKLQLRLT